MSIHENLGAPGPDSLTCGAVESRSTRLPESRLSPTAHTAFPAQARPGLLVPVVSSAIRKLHCCQTAPLPSARFKKPLRHLRLN